MGRLAQPKTHSLLFEFGHAVTLTINTNYACVETVSMTYPIPVWVYPLPHAGLNVEPGIVDILSPTVFISDNTDGATSVEYFMSDGGFSDQWNFSYDWTQSGEQSIFQ